MPRKTKQAKRHKAKAKRKAKAPAELAVRPAAVVKPAAPTLPRYLGEPQSMSRKIAHWAMLDLQHRASLSRRSLLADPAFAEAVEKALNKLLTSRNRRDVRAGLKNVAQFEKIRLGEKKAAIAHAANVMDAHTAEELCKKEISDMLDERTPEGAVQAFQELPPE